MGLRGKLERLEKRAGTHTTELLCEQCGERIKASRDIALRILYSQWLKRRAERRGEPVVNEDDPAMKLIKTTPTTRS